MREKLNMVKGALKFAVIQTFGHAFYSMYKSALCTCPTFGYDANCPNHGVNKLSDTNE